MNETNLLRPPLPPVPPGWWELNGLWVILGAVLLLAALALLVWLTQRRTKPAGVESPADRARQQLAAPAVPAADGRALSRASRVVRRYLIDRLSLLRQEMTTSEFCRELEGQGALAPDLRARLTQFLREGDTLKFAPAQDRARAEALRASALQLVNDVEAALAPPEPPKPARELTKPPPALSAQRSDTTPPPRLGS